MSTQQPAAKPPIPTTGPLASGGQNWPCPQRICLIVNPTAGQSKPGALVSEISERLGSWCTTLEVRETDSRGAGERLAKALQPGEFDLVVAVGGDGTINEVLNGLEDHTPLGIIPLGTANVLARELDIPIDDLDAACDMLRTCAPHPIDLGRCNDRRFCLMAGIGFDAEAVKEVPPSIKDLIGAPAYVLSALRALTTLPETIRYRLTLPGRRIRARALMLVVANAGSYAGTLRIAPLASIDDGYLDVCLFRERSKLAFLGQLVRVLMRRHLTDPHFQYFRAREMRIDCRPRAAVQLDGDYFGRTPVTIRVEPAAVRVVRPAP
jgi:diacylglycerol kinase (ATP)